MHVSLTSIFMVMIHCICVYCYTKLAPDVMAEKAAPTNIVKALYIVDQYL